MVLLINVLMHRSTHRVDEDKLERRWKQLFDSLGISGDEAEPSILVRLLECFHQPIGEVLGATFALVIGWSVRTVLI
jgi:hypothetical protein